VVRCQFSCQSLQNKASTRIRSQCINSKIRGTIYTILKPKKPLIQKSKNHETNNVHTQARISKLMCTHRSKKGRENLAPTSQKSQFWHTRRENGYYLLILREKYGIMGVYPGKTMDIMATFHHDRYFSHCCRRQVCLPIKLD
jgi:hypothetical protein